MTRWLQFLLLLAVCWIVMTFTHEVGHILAGWATGGHLHSADLLPWHLPQSHFEPNPHPLVTLWGGPVLGIAIPVLIAVIVRHRLAWMIAHFCILSNGLYLAVAWYTGDNHLDTARLFAAGSSPVVVGIYCALTISIGYLRFRRDCINFISDAPTNGRKKTHAQSH